MRDCTCLGTCKGAERLGDGWRCALEVRPDSAAVGLSSAHDGDRPRAPDSDSDLLSRLIACEGRCQQRQHAEQKAVAAFEDAAFMRAEYAKLEARCQQLEVEKAELTLYKRAIENHLCKYDAADWLACGMKHCEDCDICSDSDKGQHRHALLVRAESAEAALLAVTQQREQLMEYVQHKPGCRSLRTCAASCCNGRHSPACDWHIDHSCTCDLATLSDRSPA